MENLRVLDVFVMIVYFAAIALAGVYFAKRSKNTEGYFLGGRNFPWWAIGISMVGTSISSVSYLAYPADAYKTAYLRLMPAFTLPIAVLIASRVFLPFFRRGGLTSAYEYLEGRFGPGTRLYAALIFILQQTIRVSTILFLLSLLVNQLFPMISVPMCIVITGIFVAFYTVLGGIEAVVWTDVAQTLVLIFGGLFTLFYITLHLDNGISDIFTVGMEHNKFAIAAMNPDGTLQETNWSFSLVQKTAMMMLFIGLSQWLMEYSCNQNVIQRYCASKTPKDARRAMWICCWTSIPLWSFFMFLGTSMYVYYLQHPDLTAKAILDGAEGTNAEQIFPLFIINVLPAGISGLVAAGVLAAAMSSLDSSINAITTVAIVDIYRRHVAKGRDDVHYLNAARWIALATGAVMVLGALVFSKIPMKTFQDTNVILAALTMGGLFGLFGLGFFTKVGDGRSVFWGIMGTVCFSLWMLFKQTGWFGMGPETFPPFDQYYTGILSNVMMFFASFIGAFYIHVILSMGSSDKRDLTNLTVWTRDDTPMT